MLRKTDIYLWKAIVRYTDFGSHKFSRTTFGRHAILVLLAMTLHHKVKLKYEKSALM